MATSLDNSQIKPSIPRYRRQYDKKSCAPIALYNYFTWLRWNNSFEHIFSLLKTDVDGTTVTEFDRFFGYAKKITWTQLKDHLYISNCALIHAKDHTFFIGHLTVDRKHVIAVNSHQGNTLSVYSYQEIVHILKNSVVHLIEDPFR